MNWLMEVDSLTPQGLSLESVHLLPELPWGTTTASVLLAVTAQNRRQHTLTLTHLHTKKRRVRGDRTRTEWKGKKAVSRLTSSTALLTAARTPMGGAAETVADCSAFATPSPIDRPCNEQKDNRRWKGT